MQVAVIYNEPEYSRYTAAGEQEAVEGVLVEVAAVSGSLSELGCSIIRTGLAMPSEKAEQKLKEINADLVFNLFEGFGGLPESESDIAALLEKMNIPFTGCPSKVLKLALKKSELKKILIKGGIRVPESQLLNSGSIPIFHLKFPCIIKPDSEDASHGITGESVVRNLRELKKQVDKMEKSYGYPEVMVEEFIEGREFNATATGNREVSLLEISEIRFELPDTMPNILTYAGKWDKDSIDYRGTIPVCPPDITPDERERITGVVVKSFKLAGCRGYARVDMRMDSSGNIFVLEVNPNPDISPDSGAALQAKTAGMSYTAFINKIITLALEKK